VTTVAVGLLAATRSAPRLRGVRESAHPTFSDEATGRIAPQLVEQTHPLDVGNRTPPRPCRSARRTKPNSTRPRMEPVHTPIGGKKD